MNDRLVGIVACIGALVFLRQIFALVPGQIATDKNGHYDEKQEDRCKNSWKSFNILFVVCCVFFGLFH